MAAARRYSEGNVLTNLIRPQKSSRRHSGVSPPTALHPLTKQKEEAKKQTRYIQPREG